MGGLGAFQGAPFIAKDGSEPRGIIRPAKKWRIARER